MRAKHDYSILQDRVLPYLAQPTPAKVTAVVAFAGATAVMIAALGEIPAGPSQQSSSPTSVADLPQHQQQADSSCETQAWPYIERRCLESTAASRGTRQVRVVTDRGTSTTMIMPNPLVEATPAPKPPVVGKVETAAATPPVIPASPEPAQEAALQNSVAKAEPAVSNASLNSQPTAQPAPPQPAAPVAPATTQATLAPPQPQLPARPAEPAQLSGAAVNAMAQEGYPAPMTENSTFSDLRESAAEKKKSKAAKAREKREAKELKEMEANGHMATAQQSDNSVPEDVVAAVKALSENGNSRSRQAATASPRPAASKERGGQGVPSEVLAAVEAAAKAERASGPRRVIISDRAGPSGEVVTVGTPDRPAGRIYIVPRDEVEYVGRGW